MGKKFAAYDTDGAIVAFYDSEDSPVPEGLACIEITQDEWQACLGEPLYRVTDRGLIAPSIEQLAGRELSVRTASRKIEISSRLQDVSAAIAPLQDAVELGMSQDSEAARLLELKRYRIALSRLDVTASDFSWPVLPPGM